MNKKKSGAGSVLAVILVILLLGVVAVSLGVNILFSQTDTPQIFGKYVYLMESDSMEIHAAADTATAVGTAEPAGGSIPAHSAVIVPAKKETDAFAKDNAILCVLDLSDTSEDTDSQGIAVRRISSVIQEETTGIMYYYPTTMRPEEAGTEPPITADSILGKCTNYSTNLYTAIKFARSIPGIICLLILPCVILLIMLIVKIVRVNNDREDEEVAYDEPYSEMYGDPIDYNDNEPDEAPLYQPSSRNDAVIPKNPVAREIEDQRSTIGQNFETKTVNMNSPYQKAKTQQFKAVTGNEPVSNVAARSAQEMQRQNGLSDAQAYSQQLIDSGYQGSHAAAAGAGNAASFGTHQAGGYPAGQAGGYPTGGQAGGYPTGGQAGQGISGQPTINTDKPQYEGAHAAEPGQTRNLRPSRPAQRAYDPLPDALTQEQRTERQTTRSSRFDKYDSASVDDLLAMIEEGKKKLR